MAGDTPLTARLLKPALIDAETGRLTDMRAMPWYVQTIFIAQPLHFGDYGGLPLKILWAVLDIATILVLSSGLYLWASRLRKGSLHPVGGAASVWVAPVILGILMSAGLITALVGDGLWDALACILLTGILSYAAHAAFAPGS